MAQGLINQNITVCQK